MITDKPIFWITQEILDKTGIPMMSHATKVIGIKESKCSPFDIPLYTTPQTKPLSDEEIGQIFSDHLCFMIRTKEEANNLIFCAND